MKQKKIAGITNDLFLIFVPSIDFLLMSFIDSRIDLAPILNWSTMEAQVTEVFIYAAIGMFLPTLFLPIIAKAFDKDHTLQERIYRLLSAPFEYLWSFIYFTFVFNRSNFSLPLENWQLGVLVTLLGAIIYRLIVRKLGLIDRKDIARTVNTEIFIRCLMNFFLMFIMIILFGKRSTY